VERRGEAVARWAPLMVVGKLGGRPGGGISGEGRWRGGRVNALAHHWGRGGGAVAREMAGIWRCGAAMGVALGRREVRDDPDRWVPPIGERVREGEVGVGRRKLMARGRVVGRNRCGPLREK
jgi:hypothetical protein